MTLELPGPEHHSPLESVNLARARFAFKGPDTLSPMRVAVELVPRTLESLRAELEQLKDITARDLSVNIPDLLRFPVRSWHGCAHLLPHLSRVIPHIRATDLDLEKPLELAPFLLEQKISEVLVVSGDPPPDQSHQVFPTSSVQAIAKFRDELPGVRVYAALDPYRSSLRGELEYCEEKREAGAVGFFTQPFFDLRFMDVFSEMLERSSCADTEIFWGVTSVTSNASKRYWESRNRAIFPGSFVPTLEWNRQFAQEALEWVQDRGNIYFMPVRIGVREYLEGIL